MHLSFPVLSENKIFPSLFKLSAAPASAAVVTYRQNSQCLGLNFHRENNCVCNLSISFSFFIRLITNFTTTSILAQETHHSTKIRTLPYFLCLILGKFYPPRIRTKRSSGICVYTVPDKFLSAQVHNLYAFVAVRVFVRIKEQTVVRIGRYRVNASPIRTETLVRHRVNGVQMSFVLHCH